MSETRYNVSAGILLYRRASTLEVLLGHMGGPFWARKDDGAWSIPKGEYGPNEDPLAAAQREFAEEIGVSVPALTFTSLGEIKQSGGKLVSIWAAEGDLDPDTVVSNTFSMEWPPRSGRHQEFPEIDRAGWFDAETARAKLVKGQRGFVDALESVLGQPA